MRHWKFSFLLYSCVAVSLLSCGRQASSEPQTAGDSLLMKYSTLLSVTDHCLRSRNFVNVVTLRRSMLRRA